MKKLRVTIAAILTLLAVSISTYGAEKTEVIMHIGRSVMMVNGIAIPIDAEGTSPAIINSRTLLPIRSVIEAFGGSASWNSQRSEALLNCNNINVSLRTGSTTAIVNGAEKTLDTAPIIINGRTMIPVRFAAEELGLHVAWDSSIQEISISNVGEENTTTEIDEASSDEILIAYFSRTGNTETVAKYIQEITGGDLFEIKTAVAYTANYDELLDIAQKEQDENARPELSTHVANFEDYDIVILGYPIWWGNHPMAVASFAEEYDFNGVTVLPFSTSGGSGLGSSVGSLKNLMPNAVILDGFTVNGSNAGNSKENIEKWLIESGITK